MQFYENYVRLCNAEGKRPTAVADELGIARAIWGKIWEKKEDPKFMRSTL